MSDAPYVITSSDLIRNPKLYLDQVVNAETKEIFILRHGKITAKLTPVETQKTKNNRE